MNGLYFACTECKVFLDAGYWWAHWHLLHPGIVNHLEPVDKDRVLSATTYWDPPKEKTSDWLYGEVLPSARQFLLDHHDHNIVFRDFDDLPENRLLHWLQIGYCPQEAARFFAATLKFADWDSVVDYDKNVGHGGLEYLLYNDEQVEAFRQAFCHYVDKFAESGPAGAPAT